MFFKDGACQIVKLFAAGLADISLAGWLGRMKDPFCDFVGLTVRATDPVRPTQFANDAKTFGIIDKFLEV